MIPTIDLEELRSKVRTMYQQVAEDPKGEFHFEMGRALAERLGYPSEDLDRIPAEAIESFAGVGYYFDLADLREGETVLDLGSGSGMDAFFAALLTQERKDRYEMPHEQDAGSLCTCCVYGDRFGMRRGTYGAQGRTTPHPAEPRNAGG